MHVEFWISLFFLLLSSFRGPGGEKSEVVDARPAIPKTTSQRNAASFLSRPH